MNYRVQPGDTLNAIAARFGVTVEELIRVNNLQFPFQLFIGQNLFIPTQRPPRPPVPPVPGRPGNVERRLNRLEQEVNQLQRQVRELDRRVDRLEQRRPR
ncbi:LysM peptidoglycan-binding domain-containing protein [Brevibacillus migulae]|uniref:LysM peptidoglycan-binding domain-containing protein n=1 Tax=Brevibacillus migulae TaxID=1644114 RepID=UPI00106E8651|nr:LysM peptidoglycan-binding domain-containing protein [Brevibacillus migulae]